MLASKKGEYFSLFSNFNVIYCLSTLIVLLLLLNCCTIVAATSETTANKYSPDHIEKSCIEKCPEQNRNVSDHLDCGENCYKNQCAAGCKLWETALDSSCKVACNTTEQDVNDWYCVMGCNNAISQYFSHITAEIGTPPAPALLADSLTATSLSLEWQIPARLAEFTKGRSHITRNYLVQWRYEESGNDWKYCRNQSMGDNSTIHVENLQPYTKYRFRVALILSSNREMELYSEQSLVIITAEEGPPSSKPEIVRAVAVDHTRISISWEPGLLKNGPILFYVLQIKESNHDGYLAYKDIPKEQKDILIENLKPATEYSVEVKMRNKAGVGPAAEIIIATPKKPEVRHDDETLKLIIVSNYQILMQGPKFFYEPPNFIYNSTEAITGVGIHVAKKLLFITDETRAIFKAPLDHTSMNKRERIYSTEGTNQTPLALSVDWLNNKLYILFESVSMNQKGQNQKGWQISRCDFSGRQLQVVYSGLQSKPVHFQVDPFNGYVFWSLNGRTDGGIFRLDLSDVSNGVKHEIIPKLIYNKATVGVFTIDYVHYKLIVPLEESNSVKSMDLNGDKYEDIRNNTQTPMFESVKSLAMANDLFYWTSGDAVLMEEYHELNYYDNKFKDFAMLNNFLFVCVKLPSAQPTPKPLNPPTNVQSLLGTHRAKVSWRMPHLLGIQGRGAWQDWTYEMEIIDEDGNDTKRIINEIKGLHFTVTNLTEDTRYRFRVAAYTNAGYSPYSTEFRGQTLKSLHDRYLIWASHDGLVQSDILGDNVRILVPQQRLDNCNITNIEWFEDVLFFVCSQSLYLFNRTTYITEKVNVKDAVQAIAVDWIGRRLYWFNPSHQVITRGNLIDYESEVLFPLSARETDMKIDSIGGYLYFSTGHSVEFCRLNCRDKDKKEYYRMEAYSGKKVMGLTLDVDKQRIYWIVRSYDGSSLISAPMADTAFNPMQMEEHVLSEKRILGPLTYFSDRLLWLQDDHTVIISNLTGKNLAHLKNIELNELRAFSVIDPTQQIPFDTSIEINVIPENINTSTIQVTGKWNLFTISWQPVKTVTYGDVFYEIRYLNYTFTVTSPFLEIENDSLAPYTQFNMTIKAFTYWASAQATRVQLYSPPASPTKPINPRIFIDYSQNPIRGGVNIKAIFRWNQPETLNGPLIRYKIACWYEENDLQYDLFVDYHLQPEITETYMEHLPKNLTLFCKVRAVTIGGEGDFSDVVSANTHDERSIPRAFVASGEEIYIVDMDLHRAWLIVNAGSRVNYLAYIAMNEQLFYINENNELMSLSRNEKQKLHSVNALVLSLTVDWIERIVYWSQYETTGSSIVAFSLDTQKTSTIFQCDCFVFSLSASPLSRQIFWIEMSEYNAPQGKLMSYHISENRTSQFHNAKQLPIIVSGKVLFVDTFKENHEQILWLSEQNELVSTRIRNKDPEIISVPGVVNASNLFKDGNRFYWTQDDSIFAKNSNDRIFYRLEFINPAKILPLYRQNYPAPRCLLPHHQIEQNEHIALFESKERSLLLRLPIPKSHGNCSFKPSLLKYKIMYDRLIGEKVKKCTITTCNMIETYDKVAEIKNLQPFTKYQFQISISNYYAEKLNKTTNFTRPVVFQTKIGTPSQPRNVVAKTLSPTEVNVSWLPPLEWNGDTIRYEVQCQTQHTGTVKNQMQMLINEHDVTSINITDLKPNQPYSIWVRVYTMPTMYNQSESVKIITLPEPAAIELVERTSKSLQIYWEPYANALKYVVACRPIEYDKSTYEILYDSGVQTNYTNVQRNGNHLRVLNLHPKTFYVFWISLYLENRTDVYVWPQEDRFIFETLGDKPNAPGKPDIVHVRGDVYKVTWLPAENNGAPIEEYSLEGLRYRASNRMARSTDANGVKTNETSNATNARTPTPLVVDEPNPVTDEWTVYYKGNDTYWIIKDLTPIGLYSFRVRARNAYGWGGYSELSEQINEAYITSEHREYLLLAVAAPAFIIFLLVTLSCIVCAFRRKKMDKKVFQETSTSRIDVELANLRDLPHNANFVQSNNILYSIGAITDADIALLPRIQRGQVTMTSFLGSGAFGEVYEGIVKNVGNELETRVAIKTLRKGATEQEKAEFLQEAQLMSNFKHEHILRLIGVCLDKDALYIIMELMQGGDLLSFLRQCRPSDGTRSSLTLLDLMSMCVDIASGCRYLEEMHFVHRDLACRNCLVSSVDPESRVVKIGDFGLARDIYKNDYYRKDGDGLLPVRWMSPESLVDGVFTTQSDIWAFGVLCWEIMTLGQQPYQARSNVEVLHYVRDGGRLDQPDNCPESLYQLMLKCWSYRPEERPTFRYCLEVLQLLRSNCEAVQINMQNANRNLANGGIFNRLYLVADENHNHEQGNVKYSNTNFIGSPESYILPKANDPIPKYLEIIFDENEDEPQPPSNYETPRYLDGPPDVDSETPNNSCNSSVLNVQNDKDKNSYNLELSNDVNGVDQAKERTFSSSSTVSETSVCCPTQTCILKSQPQPNNSNNNNNNSLAQKNVILTLQSPNVKDNCNSKESVLNHQLKSDKIRQMYANTHLDHVLSCDGITSM